MDDATLSAIREAKAAKGGRALTPAEIDRLAPPARGKPATMPTPPPPPPPKKPEGQAPPAFKRSEVRKQLPASVVPEATGLPPGPAEDLATMQAIVLLFGKLSPTARAWVQTAVFQVPKR